jgi:hypothetical protein
MREKTKTKIMNILRNLSIPAAVLMLWSCMPDQYASVSEYDDIYFSSADMREVNYASLVQNNEAQNFSSYHNNSENVQIENFSAKNVNPDYIARYANQSNASTQNFGSDDYFVKDYGNTGLNNNRNFASQGENTTYNNYRITNNNGFGGMNPFAMGMGFGMSPWGMGGFGMNPWNMGGFGMNPWNMGGFGMSPFGFDPFFDPFFPRAGFRTGFSMGFGFSNFGFGMGSMRMRNMMAMSYGFGGGFGNPFFMDPFMMSPFGFNNFGFGGFGSPFGFGNRFYSPVVIINNSDVPRQQYVRGPRDGRSSQFANANSSAAPSTRSAVAAQRSNAGTNQVTSQRRDFSQRKMNITKTLEEAW